MKRFIILILSVLCLSSCKEDGNHTYIEYNNSAFRGTSTTIYVEYGWLIDEENVTVNYRDSVIIMPLKATETTKVRNRNNNLGYKTIF